MVITLPDRAPELHALDEQIDALCARPITHEAFTVAVAAALPEGAHVATTWHTGSWTVQVEEDGGALHRDTLVR
jgi:hypothetical protein